MSNKDIMEAEEFRQAMVEADMMEAEINAESDQEILDEIAKRQAEQDYKDECDYWDKVIPEWM